jgi:nucleoside-diphosphate-sugar epimerase
VLILLFGATGFVGQNLAIRFAEAGHEVIGVSRTGAPVAGASSCMAIDALDDLAALPDDIVCCHVAAQRYDASRFQMAQSDILTANVALTNRVYAFCAERGVKEVRLASSVAVYQSGLPLMNDVAAIDLNAPPHPDEAFYAWSKRWAEIVADLYRDRYGISTVTLRLSNPYGPMDSLDPKAAHVLPAFVLRALGPEETFVLRGDPDVERDFIWIGDVAKVFLQSLGWKGRAETFNLCTGQTVTLRGLAEEVLRQSGAAKKLVTDPHFSPAAVRTRRSSAERLCAAFDIAPFTPMEAGLAATIDWYRRALKHG